MRGNEIPALLRGKQGPNCQQGPCPLGTGVDVCPEAEIKVRVDWQLLDDPFSTSPLHVPGGHPHAPSPHPAEQFLGLGLGRDQRESPTWGSAAMALPFTHT